MFPYTVKYTESKYDIQNSNLLYKIDQQCRTNFDFFEKRKTTNKRKFEKSKTMYIFYIINKFHNPYFVICVMFVIWGLFYILITPTLSITSHSMRQMRPKVA